MDVTNAAAAAVLTASLGWGQLPPIPDGEGFAGCFAGVSGGALLNLKGECVGVITALAARSGLETPGGFALPIDALTRRKPA
jgi:S1-C subfamily serine protease